jgi:hypothetical protein
MYRTLVPLLCAALVAASAHADPNTIAGSYTTDGKVVPLVDGIVRPDFITGTAVLAASKALDRAKLWKNGRLDTHQLRLDSVAQGFMYIEFRITDDGQVDCVKVYDTIPYHEICDGLVADFAERSATHVAGTLKIQSAHQELDLRIDSAIEGQ